jgi:hypothetical protein
MDWLLHGSDAICSMVFHGFQLPDLCMFNACSPRIPTDSKPQIFVVEGQKQFGEGLNMLPIGLSPVLFATLATILMSRMGKYRILNSIGVTFIMVGMLVLSTLTEDSKPWQNIGYQFIPAIGIGILFPTRSMMIQSGQTRDEDVPMAAAVCSMLVNVGQCLGQAVGTAIWQNHWDRMVDQELTSIGLPKADIILANDLERNIFKIKSLEDLVRRVYRHIGAVSVGRVWLVMSAFCLIGLIASFFVLDLSFGRDTKTKLAYGEDSDDGNIPLLPTATPSRTGSPSSNARYDTHRKASPVDSISEDMELSERSMSYEYYRPHKL